MAQSGFQLSDDAKTITILNDSGTTAITAGDIVYSGANDDVLTGTAASARQAYAPASDIKGYTAAASATGYKTVIGVALEDIPTASVGAIATEGVFITAASDNTEAGEAVMGVASANKVVRIPTVTSGSTTTNATCTQNGQYKIGKAFTGGSADGKFIIWKLTL